MFRIHALPAARFAPLFALSDDELAARDIRRVVADQAASFPCRVSLLDAEPGERLLLLPHEHHAVATERDRHPRRRRVEREQQHVSPPRPGPRR